MRVFRRSVNLWVKDVQFVMDTLEKINDRSVGNKFYGKLDFSRLGTLGQSVGGAVSGQLCYVEDRMKAGVNLDCFQFGDLYDHEMNKPFMLMQSDSYPLWQIANKVIYSKTKPFHSIKIQNSRHFIFSDCSIFPVKFNDKLKELVGEYRICSMTRAPHWWIFCAPIKLRPNGKSLFDGGLRRLMCGRPLAFRAWRLNSGLRPLGALPLHQ